jgi:hypothetical protein
MAEKEDQLARYIIGIDLGTTNSAIAFVDTTKRPYKVEDFPVLQIVAPGEAASLSLFPSFHYEAAESEFTPDALRLPWDTDGVIRTVNGSFARDHGAEVSGRLVSSAKSWLSHSGVDRTAPLLPWHAAPDVDKISPVNVTSRYLAHMKNAWNHAHTEDEQMEHQDVIITVPASFDEIARELTVEAASEAGLPRIVLLEEPQAAFYAWINLHTKDWNTKVNAGQKILICDIGGGTTDFSLIQVKTNPQGEIQFHRVAVGDHLILGGDNLDLALAYHIEQNKLSGRKLTPRQFGALVRNCQKAKERLMSDDPPEKMTINIPGSGAALIGGALQVEITSDEANRVLIEGFFPFVDIAEKPATRQSGFQEFGLPYAPDAAATRYLAAFLTGHRDASSSKQENSFDPARPDIVLFNGGVLTSTTIRKRILDVLKSWFGKDGSWSPVVFENDHPELAVARGAAYFGLVRRGVGVRISAGLARSYYMGVAVQNEMKALCLAPAGLQEGRSIDISSRTFDLLIRQPVEFPLFVSSIRTTDSPGEFVNIDPLEMYSLPPIRTVLRSGKKLEADVAKVMLHVRLTEIGTLDLWCSEVNGNRSWKLQFDVRSATRTDIAAHKGAAEQAGFIDSETFDICREMILDTFVKGRSRKRDPQGLIRELENVAGAPRFDWPPSFLRSLWEVLIEVEPGRSIDPLHEVRWLNFTGFALRPGYGYAVDDWRIKQTWLIFQKGVFHQRNQAARAEWWILWRRVSGGLNSGQQRALAQPLLSVIKSSVSEDDSRRKVKTKIENRPGQHELAEIWRVLASLEHLSSVVKNDLGSIAVKYLSRKEYLTEALTWALGRFGSRVPLYGPLNELVDPQTASQWASELISLTSPNLTQFLSLMQLCRRTDDRYRDIDDNIRETVITHLRRNNAPHHFVELVKNAGTLDHEEQGGIFGEALPQGLRIS